MSKHLRSTEVVVADFSGKGRDWRFTLPAEEASPRDTTSQSVPERSTKTYVPRKTQRQKAIERTKRSAHNRKRWDALHEIELNETKKMLYRALRLLKRSKVELPDELVRVLSRHESAIAARAERRSRMLKQFEVKPA